MLFFWTCSPSPLWSGCLGRTGGLGPRLMCFSFGLETLIPPLRLDGGLRLMLLPPVGWVAKSITLSHCESGGATSGRWTIQVWYPPGAVVIEPVVLYPLPWLPIRCSVSDRESAAAVALAHLPTGCGGGSSRRRSLVWNRPTVGPFPCLRPLISRPFSCYGFCLQDGHPSPHLA